MCLSCDTSISGVSCQHLMSAMHNLAVANATAVAVLRG